MKHYYLYFFALIFSVTLFFSFVTLQYNESIIEATKASGTASSGFEAASYMLYFIVLFFVLYANHLFIKRRSKEIGLYQLIGMTKGLVTRLIALENILLFIGAVSIGMVLGLLSSRLFAMILLKLLKFDVIVTMTFSKVAIVNTLIVFGLLLVIILVQMAFMVRKSTLLALFTASNQADERVKRFSAFHMIMGAFGLALIGYGYYASMNLFTGKTTNLFLSMIVILATTIGGTYFVFRYSVAFVLNLFRMSKKGHLNLSDVLALTPIMHRMKGNAKSLTLITVLTAVSLTITTLSYISYYSAGTSAENQVPADYIAVDGREQVFVDALGQQDIDFEKKTFHLTSAQVDMAAIFSEEAIGMLSDDTLADVVMVSLSDYQQLDPDAQLAEGEAIITGYGGFQSNIMPLKAPFDLTFLHQQHEFPLHIKEVNDTTFIAWKITAGGFVAIVKDTVFEQLQALNEENTVGYTTKEQTSINLIDADDKTYKQVEKLYRDTGANILVQSEADGKVREMSSKQSMIEDNLNLYGTLIFTTAFLGLAFLLATGSILYFKQMSEADEEASSYTVLRKIGFTEQEILRGIMFKQLFNFGVPLLIGLLHSYFAVKSGWFLFGTELLTPLIITMSLYVVMYVVFAALTINYYKKIIKQAL
ncbi:MULTISPECIES: ABC transporter permease [unclassified Lysinibacillus]|uniref:ABC transporter permease n=1 Tax=unclassified Lysinibacillus TaxID=2636778 RepID=UPI001F102F9B|nr:MULTISPECIES: ABC transporter permease [unclassified Lysinibacillus]